MLDNNLIENSSIMSVAQTQWTIDFDSEQTLATGSVQNQKFTGKCWIYAGINFLRTLVYERQKKSHIILSANYISYYDKIEKAKFFLEKVIETSNLPSDNRMVEYLFKNPCPDAGQWAMFKNIVKKYSVVPQESMPDTYSALDSNQMNVCLMTVLRVGGSNIRRMIVNGADINLINEEKRKRLSEIRKILSICLGEPPVDFEYGIEKKKYTPSTFYENEINVDLDKYVCLINAPMTKTPFYKRYCVQNLNNVSEGSEIEYINLPVEYLIEKTIRQIRNCSPVWFGCDAGKMVDKKTGIMDDNTFDVKKVFNTSFTFSKGEQLEYHQSMMNHAMLIVGIIFKGKDVVGFKVEDSHGNKVGKNGFFYMSMDWFEKYVYQVVIEDQYLSKYERKLLCEEISYLMPWSPIGTLAK